MEGRRRASRLSRPAKTGRRQKVQRARCGLQRRLNDNERVLKELQAAKGFWTPTMEVLMRGWVQGRACKV